MLMLRSPWVVGGGIGPVLGGSLAQIGRWYATPFPSGSTQLFSIYLLPIQEVVVL